MPRTPSRMAWKTRRGVVFSHQLRCVKSTGVAQGAVVEVEPAAGAARLGGGELRLGHRDRAVAGGQVGVGVITPPEPHEDGDRRQQGASHGRIGE